jgi:hypothetical protein
VALTLQFYTHAVSRDLMVATGRMLKTDSQPRARQKRTDSVLDRKTVQDEFFKGMDVSIVS